jgi:hypothetical protein
MNSSAADSKWNERTSAPARFVGQSEVVFQSLLERSAEAVWLREVVDQKTAFDNVNADETQTFDHVEAIRV